MYITYNNDRFQWILNPRGEYILIDTVLCRVVSGSTLPNDTFTDKDDIIGEV